MLATALAWLDISYCFAVVVDSVLLTALLASFPGFPPPHAQLVCLTYDPPAQKSEGEPGSKHHLNVVAGRRYLIGVGKLPPRSASQP